MTEREAKTEAEAPGFASELCDELSDEALDRREGEYFGTIGTSVLPCAGLTGR